MDATIVASLERSGVQQRRNRSDPEADHSGTTACTRRAVLVAEEVAHVVAERTAERAREHPDQRGEDVFRDGTSLGAPHVAHRRTTARTAGEVTSVWSRRTSAATTRPPSAVRR